MIAHIHFQIYCMGSLLLLHACNTKYLNKGIEEKIDTKLQYSNHAEWTLMNEQKYSSEFSEWKYLLKLYYSFQLALSVRSFQSALICIIFSQFNYQSMQLHLNGFHVTLSKIDYKRAEIDRAYRVYTLFLQNVK